MTSPLLAKLAAVRRRHAAVALASAAVATIAASVLCLAGGMVLDRYLNLSHGVRAGLLIVDGTVCVALVLWRGVLPVVREPDVYAAARRVERAVPALANELVAAVEFLRPPAPLAAGPSAGLVRAAVRRAEAAAAAVDFAAAVPTRPAERLAAVAAAVVVACGVGFALGGRTSVALAGRALLLRDVPLPHRTHVTLVDADRTVVRGDPVTLAATATGVVPPAGTVHVRFANGAAADRPVANAGGRFECRLDDAGDGLTYRVAVGDDESADGHVTVADRPAVLGVRCRVTPPAYAGGAAVDRSPWELSMLAGSSLGLTVTASVPSVGRVAFAGAKLDVPLAAVGATTLPMPPTAVPAGATGFRIELVSTAGIASRDPVLYPIEVLPDRPPTVRLVTPATDGTVTAVAHPAVAIEADDDVGVARLALRYRVTHAGQSTAADDDPNGLTGAYGPIGVTRVDQDVNVGWSANPPPAGVDGGRPYGVRWTGSLRPTVSDDYWFGLAFSGGARLTVAGRVVYDRPAAGEAGPVPLVAGRLYPVVVETTAAAGGEARLSWWGRRVLPQVVPHANLYRRTVPYDPPADADGLVDYWPLDEGTGGFAHDAAGPADGTLFDAGWTDGRVGRGLALTVEGKLGGRNERVEAPGWAGMQYRAEDSFTLAAWVRPGRAVGQPQAIVSHARDSGGGYGLGIDAAGRFVASSAAGRLVGPAATPRWHHVALVQDGPGRARSLYVDGVAVVTGPAQNGGSDGAMIFGNTVKANEPFDGSLDEVRLYGRAVTAAEVRALFADPHVTRVPTQAEIGGISGTSAAAVPVEVGPPARHVERRMAWDLSAARVVAGDTVEVWAEAADGNTVTGPGVAASEHRRLRVVTADEKRRELMGQLGDYLGQVQDVTDGQRALAGEVGKLATRPTTRGGGGRE